MTFTPTAAVLSGTFTSSWRIEYLECRVQTVTINGDPAMLMDGAYTFDRTTGNALSSMTATTRMTGGLRFDTAGTPGRARFDCTLKISMQIGSDGTPAQPTLTSSGTMTWEQPLGTVAVHPCGG